MYYISMVRNLVNNINNDNVVELLRKHILKSGIKHALYITKEISPARGQVHCHAIIGVSTVDDLVGMELYLDKHLLKTYVDKNKRINNFYEMKAYLKYIRKDITEVSKKYIDYYEKDYDKIVWSNIINYKNPHLVDDPFIDSEEELINNMV